MRQNRDSAPASLRRLVRFLLGYGLALLLLFRVLPAAALFVQDVYDGLGALSRFALVAGLVIVVAAWQVSHYHGRFRARAQRLHRSQRS